MMKVLTRVIRKVGKPYKLKVAIWRRGRGLNYWNFEYVTQSVRPWFTTPGWYRPSGRGRMYRLTIDHDFPQKPIWLGYKRGSKWVNAERLYEVLFVTHTDFFIANRRFAGSRGRSNKRRATTAVFLERASQLQVMKGLAGETSV